MKIVLDVALVGMTAGETCPCVSVWTKFDAVLTAGVFDSIFSIFFKITFLWGIGITFPGAVSFGSGAGPYGSPVLAHTVSEVAKLSNVPSS